VKSELKNLSRLIKSHMSVVQRICVSGTKDSLTFANQGIVADISALMDMNDVPSV